MQFALQRDIRAPLNTRDGQYDDLLDNLWVTILNQRLTALVDNGQLPAASINPQGAMLDSRRLQQLMIVHPQGGDYLGSITLLWTEIQRTATQPVTQAELDDARRACWRNSVSRPPVNPATVMIISPIPSPPHWNTECRFRTNVSSSPQHGNCSNRSHRIR